jgi:hypothetical protein
MTILKVKAVGGVRVPYQHNARKYIEDQAVDVPNTAYYLRQIAVGDLVIVTGTKKDMLTESKNKATAPEEVSRGQS